VNEKAAENAKTAQIEEADILPPDALSSLYSAATWAFDGQVGSGFRFWPML
jgi:hypothetical protein